MKTRLLIIFAILILASGIGFQESFACSCVADPDYDQAIADADTAFQGTVLKIEEGSGFQKVHFMIHSVQKGDLEEGIFVMTNVNIYMDENKNGMLNSCDPGYEKGNTYQVIGWGSTEQNPVGETNMCSTRTIGSIIVELDDAHLVPIPHLSPLKQQQNGVPPYEQLNYRLDTDSEFLQLLQTEVVGFGVDEQNEGIFIVVDPMYADQENFDKYEEIFRVTIGEDVPIKFEVRERADSIDKEDPDFFIFLVIIFILVFSAAIIYFWRKRK